jgi:hypothetical protein
VLPNQPEEMIQETRYLDNGERVIAGKPPFYSNLIEEFQTFDVDVYINTFTNNEFFHGKKPRITKEKPIWQLKGLNYTTVNMPSYYEYDLNHTLDFSEGSQLRNDVLLNKTLYVHM